MKRKLFGSMTTKKVLQDLYILLIGMRCFIY